MANLGGPTGTLGTVMRNQYQKCFCRMGLQEATALVQKLHRDMEEYILYNMPVGTTKEMLNEMVAEMPRQSPQRVELQQRLSYLDRVKAHAKKLRKEATQEPSELEQLQPNPRTMPTIKPGSLSDLLQQQRKSQHTDPAMEPNRRRRS